MKKERKRRKNSQSRKMAVKPCCSHQQQVHTKCNIRSCIHFLIPVIITAILVLVVFLTSKGSEEEYSLNERCRGACLISNVNESLREGEDDDKCDFFNGKWVFDDESYPLYKESECTFMSDQLACEKFGRKDLEYQNWRWQPRHCDLPRFNGTALLERLRDKRLMFVGDSLNRGQWVSMVCMVEKSIPSHLKNMHTNGSLITFKAIEYNATIEFYWAPLLVESNSDDPVYHKVPERIVRIQGIEKHARHWTNADILVFDTYLWWLRSKMKVLWGVFENPDLGIYKDVEMSRVYELALQTWANWLELHINSSITQLFFVSLSPTHQRAEEWGGNSGQNCYNETNPITKDGYWGSGSDTKLMRIAETTVAKLKDRGLNVKILNITQLSEYRKEGHPSIYRKQWETLSQNQVLNPSSYADCIHWCLPGVPDVWNELLYAYISQSNVAKNS